MKSDFGAAIVWGKTYYLHKKPLAGMIKFGIDWSWMDLNYAQYKLETYDYDTKRPTSSNTVCRSARR